MLADSFHYPPQLQDLVSPLSDMAFDYSIAADNGSREQLSRLRLNDLFEAPIADPDMANCCLSGLWLLHGFLDQSHELSQAIARAEGSFWHAIMHRAEGDFWNSKYWYRKVGSHAALCSSSEFYGESLVDLCEKATQDPRLAEQANQWARQEWLLLFDHCWKHAT